VTWKSFVASTVVLAALALSSGADAWYLGLIGFWRW
jgi:hypothetical protein